MNLHKRLLCTVGVALLLSSTTLLAANKTARNILNKAYQTIGSMDKYAFEAIVVDNEEYDTPKVKSYRQTVKVKVDRPGKLRVDTKGDIKNRSNYLNDGLFTMYDHDYKYYAQLKTPKNIDSALDALFEKFGIKAPLAQLIYKNMDKRVKFKRSKYFGKVIVSGVECDYIAFKNSTREIHLWITREDKPLIKAYSIIDTDKNVKSRSNTTIIWDKNTNIKDSDFVFKAPKGSSKISVIKAN
jgi:hypothetical protein